MSNKVKPIPDSYHTLIPHLIVKGAGEAIEFYKKAFGAVEVSRAPGPDGKTILHAELRIAGSPFFLADEFPDMNCRGPQSIGGTPVTVHMFVEDVDAAFRKAEAAGAKVLMPPADMFWGDRYGTLADPFGHSWSMASRKENLTHEEIGRRSQAAFVECAK